MAEPRQRTPHLANAPDYLVPRMGGLPVSSTRHYRTVTLTRLSKGAEAQELTPLEGPLSLPQSGQAQPPALRPGVGVILTHEQGWYAEGVALGRLLHSVCLAPGEITQVAVTKLRRSSRGRALDEASVSESLEHDESAQSALSEVQDGVVRELQAGSTVATASGTSADAGAGGLMGLFGVSGGMSTNLSSSLSVSHSAGTREVASSSNQRVHQTASQQARLARAQRRSAVREVTERETSELTSRVVANYNHMHALTVKYFEVLQVYRLRTRTMAARRCVFVPMRVVAFSQGRKADGTFDADSPVASFIARHRLALACAAYDAGNPELAAAIRLQKFGTDLREAQLSGVEADLTEARTKLEAARKELKDKEEQHEATLDLLLGAKEALRGLEPSKLVERAQAQRRISRYAEASTVLRQEVEAATNRVFWYHRLTHRLDLHNVHLKGGKGYDLGRIATELDNHKLYYNQAIWMQLTPADISACLGGYQLEDEPLTSTIDPTPVAVHGAHVVFPWGFSDPKAADAFETELLDQVTDAPQEQVTLPTDGVFAEAVLGESIAAEKIDISRFWNWHDALPPIRPTEIDDLEEQSGPRARAPGLPNAPGSYLNLNPLAFPATSSGLSGSLGLVSKVGLFRDLGGSEITAKLAQAAAQHVAKGSMHAAELATQNFGRLLKFQEALLRAASDDSLTPTMAGAAMNARGTGGRADPDGDDLRVTFTPVQPAHNAQEPGEPTDELPAQDPETHDS